jgi:poly(A) polymerase
VLAAWKAATARGERPMPALFDAMDRVLDQQAKTIAIPRRFEATIKEIWSLQPRFEQRSGARPYRLLEHPHYRAGWDFLDAPQSGGSKVSLPGSRLWDVSPTRIPLARGDARTVRHWPSAGAAAARSKAPRRPRESCHRHQLDAG